ncbi:MAG: DUF4258 domain-containing protein [Selenomonadaceae bacterium]|nr:DUF4258 domain-containing protein [Selenomonadaceae bacterium]
MPPCSLERIKNLCDNGNLRWTMHIMTRLLQRGISLDDVTTAIKSGEILENYPDDYPYPSCLIFEHGKDAQALHVVCGANENDLWLITAYRPSPENWEDDLKTRRR